MIRALVVLSVLAASAHAEPPKKAPIRPVSTESMRCDPGALEAEARDAWAAGSELIALSRADAAVRCKPTDHAHAFALVVACRMSAKHHDAFSKARAKQYAAKLPKPRLVEANRACAAGGPLPTID